MTDIGLYNSLLQEYLLRLEALHELDEEEVRQIITPMCRVLRVGRIRLDFYENADREAARQGRQVVLFTEEDPQILKPLSMREVTGGDNIVIYHFYSRQNSEPWDAEDLERIRLVQKMLHALTGRSRLQGLLEHRTYTDPQLHTKNLAFVMRRFGRLIGRREIYSFGACFFNLKRFSLVNERLGRKDGTDVMTRYILMLESKLEEPGAVGRVGGDNFIVVFKKEQLDMVRTHLRGQAVKYREAGGERVMISAVAGFYMMDPEDDLRSPEDIMDRISVAFGTAKMSPDTDEVFYSETLKGRQIEMKRIEGLFPEAVENNEFKVYYQPKVNLENYELGGAEALCRWYRGSEVIPPVAFIPVLEHSTNVCVLDFYMLEHVCRDIRRWLDSGREPVRVSVNFSRRHLGDMDLVDHILEIIDRYEIPHGYIEIELTETTSDVEFNDLKRVVGMLQKEGILTSVDDFGTGYSSLNLIREVPWNVLKIDKMFLPHIEQTETSVESIMLRYVIAMAQEMGLECIVEGVETPEQLKVLLDNKCFMAQGFYFDRPLPVAEFETRLDHRKDYYCAEGKR